ncbi:di-heme oxidoredictase family protein [Leptospira sp. 'Mane']|uniref:di-heme oxidoreductase family protein n=1 Tax=Leptospira sp. 'Mane' TaxID=3387407 RepID=UPI00398AE119
MTSTEVGERAFLQFAPNSKLTEISEFTIGQSVFDVPWTPGFSASLPDRDGLGPIFHRDSCLGCHVNNGRTFDADGTRLISSLIRLGVGHGGKDPEPSYGSQLQPNGVAGVPAEGNVILQYDTITGSFGDGTGYTLRSPKIVFSGMNYGALASDLKTSVRMTQQVVGLGLLEAVSEDTILSFADQDDKDKNGISGRPNYIPDLTGSGKTLGRFGWKANVPNLKRQNSAAFLGDIGITNPMFPAQNCTPAQTQCSSATNGGSPEVSEAKIVAITKYMQLVAVPKRRSAYYGNVLDGKRLFHWAGCANCHISKMKTISNTSFPLLASQTIRPFTDLLLHDMGEGLADGKDDGEANGNEWRTAPLWGIGLLETVNGDARYLHDGRARTLMEAILWHGGEAEKSKNFVKNLNSDLRDHLIQYLQSL